MKMIDIKKKTAASALIIFTFIAAIYGKRFLSNLFHISIDSELLRSVYSYSWWIIPVLIALGILFGIRNIFNEIGLKKQILKPFVISLISCTPMLISSAIIGEFNSDISFLELLKKTVFAGFFEEFLFRGFLFGILFRRMSWGFISAAAIPLIIFGISHLYQAGSASESIGIFMITFIGSLWFSWLYIEWRENLWVPIFMHILMNFSWIVFDISNNSLGTLLPNMFRIATIATATILTIQFSRKEDYFRITKKNLFVNR